MRNNGVGCGERRLPNFYFPFSMIPHSLGAVLNVNVGLLLSCLYDKDVELCRMQKLMSMM